MSKVPFKVSARAARLIGRENVSNAEGAVIELVKNCYDADAKICILYFDNKYFDIPNELSLEEYKFFSRETFENKLIEKNYAYNEHNKKYILNESIDESESLYEFFREKNSIYIIDNGDGMGKDTLENYWMTIGTDNKESNYKSNLGRVRAGAKGIGRFALDRLGEIANLFTKMEKSNFGYEWYVNWSDFEKNHTTINNVYAELNEIKNLNIEDKVTRLLQDYKSLDKLLEKNSFEKGTLIKISNLRDEWSDIDVKKVFSNLRSLIPPKEKRDFEVHLISSLNVNDYGEIADSICDDFDYKVFAELREDTKFHITIYRNEFEVDRIDSKIFELPAMKDKPFDYETFKKGQYESIYEIEDILPGYDKKNYEDIFKAIGTFDFNFYYMKRATMKEEKMMYYQKEVNGAYRSEWLNKFGGIKIYRDNFFVRPYGEINSKSFDWLGLGDRADKSTAGPSHKSGSWRVRPNQVYGTINISRLNNIMLADQSNRQGIQENKYFEIFQNIIIGIILLFEKDRQKIIRTMSNFHEEKNEEKIKIKIGKKIAKKIISEIAATTYDNNKVLESNETKLAQTVVLIEKEKEELISEIKLLRALASIGIVISAFTHQLFSLNTKLIGRTVQLEEILDTLIPKEVVNSLQEYQNPYIMLDQFRDDDEKLEKWLNFSIDVIKKDKRKRKKIDIYNLFRDYKRSWDPALSYYSTNLIVPNKINKKFMYRVFPIDIDTIFNNLIANSIEIFTKRKDASNHRNIIIDVYEENKDSKKYLIITYEDSGPGLLLDIKNPYEIFEPHFTTKRDSLGNEIGTGLGMWMVKATTDEYSGVVKIIKERPGFKLEFAFPLRQDEGEIVNEV